MKLSVSAYRAHASAHKKILSNSYHSQLNYGSTASASTSAPTGYFMVGFSSFDLIEFDILLLTIYLLCVILGISKLNRMEIFYCGFKWFFLLLL